MRVAGAFIRVAGEMHRSPAYFDNPGVGVQTLYTAWISSPLTPSQNEPIPSLSLVIHIKALQLVPFQTIVEQFSCCLRCLEQLLFRHHRESLSHLQLGEVAHQAELFEGFPIPFHATTSEMIGLNILLTPVRPQLAVLLLPISAVEVSLSG